MECRSILALAALLGLPVVSDCAGDAGVGADAGVRGCGLVACVDGALPGDAGDADSGALDTADAGLAPALAARPLWQPGDLATNLASVQALDVRAQRSFSAGHIPGALWLDPAQLRGVDDKGVGGQALPPEMTAAVLGRAALDATRPVVVYGAGSDLSAARVAWTLVWMGHASVHLLDGGSDAWERAGQATEAGPVPEAAIAYPSDRVASARLVDTAWVEAHLDDPSVVLLDARSRAEYDAGHIPGALSFDWTGNMDGDRLLSRSALEARHADLPRDATLVAYCQTGSRASMAWFVLHHLGFEDARLYDGSMAAWTADAGRPLE